VTATASPVFDRRATDTPLYAFDLLELNGQDLRHDSRCARRRWRASYAGDWVTRSIRRRGEPAL
jgi:hypothetical protein